MSARTAIRSQKYLLEAGGWHTGKIPKAAFPLSHVKSHHRLGHAWQWCVHLVADEARRYRLLVAFEPGKRQYWAWLGAVFGEDQAVIARVEYHASHDGWHCHWKTGDITEVPRGAVKAPFPLERRQGCGTVALDITRSDACGIAYRLFNVSGAPEDGQLL